ncbi:hypothetical protein PI125_g24444 [Phytophthora idaei]|nr:hypothetical protein PI125_g24444 [Phytophthora idaei]
MESRLAVLVVLLLLLVLIVALFFEIRRQCLQRVRIDWEERAQLLLDEGQFKKRHKTSYPSFMTLAAKLEPISRRRREAVTKPDRNRPYHTH